MSKTAVGPSQVRLLTFTGDRHQRRYEVLLSGKPVHLTCSLLTALLELVIARGTTATGYLEVNRLTIGRLPEAIDDATAPGAGAELVETGCGEEYRLTIPAEDLATQVAVSEAFLELARAQMLSEEGAQHLEKHCSVLKRR